MKAMSFKEVFSKSFKEFQRSFKEDNKEDQRGREQQFPQLQIQLSDRLGRHWTHLA